MATLPSAAQGSSLIQRLLLAARAGLGFKGARDYYDVFGYPQIITPADMLARYERQDIAKRVVDQPPEATWAYPPTIEGDASALSVWGVLESQCQVSAALHQVDRLCNFDRYAIMWLGLAGKPDTPASRLSSPDDIKYITAHGAGDVRIVDYERNTSNERFGRPVMYEVTIQQESATSVTVKVHWTRVVHVCDTPLKGNIFAVPRLQPVYNILTDIMKVAGASAETYWLMANRGMQVDIDKDMTLGAGDAEALSAELDEYQHQLRRYVRTRGVKINNLGSDVADPMNTFSTLLSLLAAATSIPQRILIGAEAGQLASEQDRANWAEFIDRRRRLYAQPYVLLPVFLQLERLGLLKAGVHSKLKYIWPEAFHQNPLEESQTMSAKARALINLSRQSQYGTPYVGMKEGRVWLGLPPELPADDELPMPKLDASKTGKNGKAQKQGGDPSTGGAGGNDGSGDSGGGASNDPNAPSGDNASTGSAATNN